MQLFTNLLRTARFLGNIDIHQVFFECDSIPPYVDCIMMWVRMKKHIHERRTTLDYEASSIENAYTFTKDRKLIGLWRAKTAFKIPDWRDEKLLGVRVPRRWWARVQHQYSHHWQARWLLPRNRWCLLSSQPKGPAQTPNYYLLRLADEQKRKYTGQRAK